uniref:DUF659 domain-containing protein n=1 Tax=Latimeria chalumnae TaxID=7897 RepID=H3A679_LATCH
IPGRTQLTETYLPEVYLEEKENLKLMLKDKKIAVIFDECCDEAKSVLNVLFAPLEHDCSGHVNSFLVDPVFLDAVNHSTVSQAVVKAVNEYQIDYENILVIDTDNASYMKKAFDSVFSTLFPNSVHITCLAHIVNLIGESFRKPFQQVDTFVRCFKNMFCNSGSRNQKLEEESPDAKASMPPSPVGMRWNSWFHAIQYHSKNSKKCEQILSLNLAFESRKPCTVKAFDLLEELQIYFISHLELLSGSTSEFNFREAENLSPVERLACLDLFKEAFHEASEKLDKYLSFGQQGLNFLKAYLQVLWLSVKERILNIAKLALNCVNAVSNSADAERSFSLYNLILSARRKSLNEKNLKALCFLYYNSNE